jgi:hypothetical protein
MIDPSGHELTLPQELTLSALKSVNTLAPIFYDMHLFILRAKQGFFVSSDNPVVQEVDPRTRHRFYGDGGLMNKTVEVMCPLSREILLLMSWSNAPRKKELDRPAVDLANKATAAHSDRYLYAHLQHSYVEALAAEFKDSRPNMTVQGFGPEKFAPVKVSRRSKPKSRTVLCSRLQRNLQSGYLDYAPRIAKSLLNRIHMEHSSDFPFVNNVSRFQPAASVQN